MIIFQKNRKRGKSMGNQPNQLKDELFEKYGYLIGGSDLAKIMGFRSSSSFNRAAKLKSVGIIVFSIENRKGKFALTEDVARWLEQITNSVHE